jgi:hypothetical protein
MILIDAIEKQAEREREREREWEVINIYCKKKNLSNEREFSLPIFLFWNAVPYNLYIKAHFAMLT